MIISLRCYALQTFCGREHEEVDCGAAHIGFQKKIIAEIGIILIRHIVQYAIILILIMA